MVSYDDLPSDPFERRTEIDRRIEAEISKLLVRRRIKRRASIVTALVIAIGVVWYLQYRFSHHTPVAENHIAMTTTFRAQGELNAAIKQLDIALTLDPAHLGARRLRAELALEIGNGADARAHLLESSQDGRSPVVLLGLMRADLLDRNFPQVASESAAQLARAPGEELELILAGAQIGNREIALASGTLDKLLTRLKKHRAGLLLRARLRLATGQISGAAEDLATLVRNGETLGSDLLKGELALASADLDGARASFDSARNRRPGHPEVTLGMARVALLAKDTAAALDSLSQVGDNTASPTVVCLRARGVR